ATEEPTPRRLAEARGRGDVAVSRQLWAAAVLAVAVCVLLWDGPAAVAAALAGLRAALAAALGPAGLGAGVGVAAAFAPRVLAPVLGAVLVASVAAGVAQTGGLV